MFQPSLIFVRTDDTDANRQPPSPNLSFYRIFIAHLWLYGTPTIVGYGNNGLRFGYSLVTPQFVTCSGEAFTLEGLQAVGDETSDNVSVSTIDAFGALVSTYTWNDWAADAACWVDDSYTPVEGVAVPVGQAFWVGGSAEAQSLQSAGQVGMKDVSVALRFGYTLLGNPFPVAVALQDIVAEGEACSDNVSISTIDSFGGLVATYTWNDWAADNACWVDDSYTPVEGVSIAPGQGLWAGASAATQAIRFPAPEL